MKDEKELVDELTEMHRSGRLDRRTFMGLLAASGITLASVKQAPAAPPPHLDSCIGCHGQAPGTFVTDPITDQLIQRTKDLGIETVYDRGTPCPYSHDGQGGAAGLCCFRCQMGPCTLGEASAMYANNPEKAERGCCGATKDVIVTRDLIRRIAGGASAHIEHARAAALTLKLASEDDSPYTIADVAKLDAIHAGLGCKDPKGGGNLTAQKATLVAEKCLEDLGKSEGTPAWLEYKASAERKATYGALGILPTGGSAAICEAQHRTHMGVDADLASLATFGLKLGLVDGYCGLHMATGIQDILFGTPSLVFAKANLSVIEADKINIVIHGHEPILSEKIVEVAADYPSPPAPINIVGMCCTGNELLMRKGVNLAGSMVQQELAIATGAVEAMVVDVQCIMPGVQRVATNFHTKVITTNPQAHITGADRILFEPENANAVAQQIVQAAVNNYANRVPSKVFIPSVPPKDIVAGFSVEQIIAALSAVDPNDPVGLLVSLIAADPNTASLYIRGIVGIVGCVTPHDDYGYRHIELTRRLLAENILVVGTGCWAHVAGQFGLLAADPAYPGVGAGLKAVLQAVATATGLPAVPACWHMGSCVDNARIEDVLNAVAAKVGVKISQLPVAASAPEFITEKAVSIGTWAVDLGLFTHIGGHPYRVLVK